jgi:hypothetical protein
MKNHFVNFVGGAVPCYAVMSTTPVVGIDPAIAEAIKAIVSLVVGVVGALVTNLINKWLQKNSGNNPPPEKN